MTSVVLITGGSKESRLAQVPTGSETITLAGSSVDDVRAWQKQLWQKPFSLGTKIAIIDDGQNLTPEAQNAILKILEEPPENTAIYLLCPNPTAILPTILSRCQLIILPPKIPSIKDRDKFLRTLVYIKSSNYLAGWKIIASIITRDAAQEFLDSLLLTAREELKAGRLDAAVVRKILICQKYLIANTAVKLTLENLFLNP